MPLDGRDPDLVGIQLWEAGAVGVEELSDALRAAFTDPTIAAAVAARFAPGAAVETLDDRVGLDGARDLLAVETAGRFAIHPPWLEPPGDLLAIAIDPGHAFGSGSHASTRLALELLGDHVEPGDHIADVGCGTGVLAIGAARLGATVDACDIDAAAVEATRTNAAMNGVADRIDVLRGEPDPTARTDLVVVNVTIDVHEAIADALPAAPRMIVSGLLAGEQVERAARLHGRDVERHATQGEWGAAVLGPRTTAGVTQHPA